MGARWTCCFTMVCREACPPELALLVDQAVGRLLSTVKTLMRDGRVIDGFDQNRAAIADTVAC
jgi:hypothetical protein